MRTLKSYQHRKPARRNGGPARGFTLVEVVIAITVLVVGLCALAALVAQSLTGTTNARYLSTATTLASEKLEDLDRWQATDPNVVVPVGQTSVGSLTTDATGTPNYYDDVDLSNGSGQVVESTAGTTGGTTTYNNVTHNATGYIVDVDNATSPATTGAGTLRFHRRWLIELSPAVNGITLTGSRRVTVVVTLATNTSGPGVSFQMSMIRP
jgi:prepilin-type N-terminal cleavage/methylation domain-containing protein